MKLGQSDPAEIIKRERGGQCFSTHLSHADTWEEEIKDRGDHLWQPQEAPSTHLPTPWPFSQHRRSRQGWMKASSSPKLLFKLLN